MTDYKSILPLLTSNTTPSPYVASASSTYTGYDAWKAFNGVIGEQDTWITSSGVSGWLAIKLPSPQKVDAYELTNIIASGGSLNNMPKDWVFQGSNDGVEWINLDTRTNEINWGSGEKRVFDITNPNDYINYRINVSNNNGSSYLGISEMQLYKKQYQRSFIYNDRYYKKYNEPIPSSGGGTENLIPIMTSYNTPSGLVKQYGQTSDTYAAWQIFDNINNSPNTSWVATTNLNPWVSYEFNDGIEAYSYELTVVNSSGWEALAPKSWKIEGSNDELSWTILDTKTGVNAWNANETRKFELSTHSNYKIYRITITEGFNSEVGIGALRLFGSPEIIPEVPGYWENISSSLPNVQVFENQGMVELSPLLDRKITDVKFINIDIDNSYQNDEYKVYTKIINFKYYPYLKSIKTKEY